MKSFLVLFQNLELYTKPDIIVLIGDFISERNQDKESTQETKLHFEQLGHIIRSNHFPLLREQTQWLLVSSNNDPGHVRLYPGMKIAEYFLQAFKGTGPSRIRNAQLCTNPSRIVYYGKEIVISKFDYYKKLLVN